MRSIAVKIWMKFGKYNAMPAMDGYEHFELFGILYYPEFDIFV